MNIQVNGYAIDTLKQALQESTMLWQERIDQAERGERQNLSIEGARAMQDDLRDILEQIRLQDA
jgi:ABC-type transport system involved in cytochrome bd biosynthesis fused ATPase/permease subunit